MSHFRIPRGKPTPLETQAGVTYERISKVFVPSYQDKVYSVNTNKLSYVIQRLPQQNP